MRYARLDVSWISHVFIYEWLFTWLFVCCCCNQWCFMIGVSVWWVYLAPENIPSATVLTLGNEVVLYCSYVYLGVAWIAQWIERRTQAWSRSRGFESWQERRENFLLRGQLSVLTLISVSVPPPCYRHCTHPTYVVLHEVTWHGACLYGIHRTRWDGIGFTWHQPHNNQTAL